MAFGNDRAETDTVLASRHGPGFDGQLTASAEIFDAYGYTAAHNPPPLGTEITVSYAGRSVDVVVDDRGPYSGGRELDLPQGAAEYLGLTAAGVDYADYEVAGAASYAEPEYEEPPYEEAEYAGAEYDDGSGGETASGGYYVVRSGDTLNGIVAGLGTNADSLMAANGVTDPDLLQVGQTLSC